MVSLEHRVPRRVPSRVPRRVPSHAQSRVPANAQFMRHIFCSAQCKE